VQAASHGARKIFIRITSRGPNRISRHFEPCLVQVRSEGAPFQTKILGDW
jgi:hypothetical protein